MTALSVKDCLRFGWDTFKARPWIFIQAGVLLFLVNLGVSLGQVIIESGGMLGGEVLEKLALVISTIIGIAASFLVSMGQTAFYLRAEGEVSAVGIKDLWHPESFWKFIGATVLAGIAIVVGFLFVVVPGIILSILFMFVGFLVIEEKLMPIAALKESIRLTKGNRLALFLLGLALLGINIVGFLFLLVGLLVSVPISFLALTHAYRTLKGGEVVETAPIAA